MTVPDKKVPVFFLDEETKTLFKKTRDLLDQILETFEILEDPDLSKLIQKAEQDYETGQTVSLKEYLEGKRSSD
jgi:hypothetical protein